MSEKKEQKSLFEVLNLVRDEYLLSQEEEKKIYAKMKEELIEAERKVKLSYQEKINLSEKNSLTLQKKLDNYQKLLKAYSTFDANIIGNIIEKLVSFVEGEEYSYQEATHQTYDCDCTIYGKESFRVNKKKLMIVKGSQKLGHYYDYDEHHNEIDNLIKDGLAFLLLECKNHYNEKITFYTTYDGTVKCLVDFNKFFYVKDFIDLVIQFRFENNLEKISEQELLNLLSEFILREREMIENYYKKRSLEKQELLRKQLINGQLNFK